MKHFILVFLGGGLGSVVRYGITRLIGSYAWGFPMATLLANVAACFVLGLIVGLADSRQLMTAQTRLFWAVGFCGGFSTFSTFSHETLHLLTTGNQVSSALYVIVSVALCLMAVFIGQWLIK